MEFYFIDQILVSLRTNLQLVGLLKPYSEKAPVNGKRVPPVHHPKELTSILKMNWRNKLWWLTQQPKLRNTKTQSELCYIFDELHC